MSAATWSAYVAPVGVLSEDGRQLSPDVEWELFAGGPMPLLRLQPREVVGTVDDLATKDGCLVARGRLVPGLDVGGLTGLLPQVEVHAGPGDDGVKFDEGAWTFTFTSGQIRAVVLGDSPAWPGLWFRVGDAVAAAPPVST